MLGDESDFYRNGLRPSAKQLHELLHGGIKSGGILAAGLRKEGLTAAATLDIAGGLTHCL